jgi:hypothetical protein
MSVEVRAALEVDLDALIQLNHVVQSLHAVLYPGDFTQMVDPCAVRSFFAARLAGPKSAIGIAEADRVPIGYASTLTGTDPLPLIRIDPASAH